jgi:Rieske Fe-S protein
MKKEVDVPEHETPGHQADCDACPVTQSRRAFFKDAAATAIAAALTLGLSRTAAAQLPVLFTTAIRRSPREATYALPTANGVQIDRDAEVILVRWEGEVHAFNLSCPHQRTALRWNDGAQRFQCPKHHSQYTPAGEFITGRATRGMDRFAIRLDAGNVIVDVETMYKQDDDAAAWTAAVVRVA